MKKTTLRIIAGAMLCMLLVTSAFAIYGQLSSTTAKSCGGSIYSGTVPNSGAYSCSIGHSNCTVQPIFYTTVGSESELYHFHCAYHSGTGEVYYYCPY